MYPSSHPATPLRPPALCPPTSPHPPPPPYLSGAIVFGPLLPPNPQPPFSPPHASPPTSVVDGDPSAYTNLFVAPLPKSVRNDDLLNVFLPFRASHASVMMDVNTGRSKGFGFVAFEDPNDGYAAAQALRGKCYVAPNGDAYRLNVSASHHQKSACLNESRHVYFRNIPITLPAEHVERVLGQFGRLVGMQLRLDSLQRWYMACVEYEDVQSARLAVKHGHGKVLFPQSTSFPVMVKFADSRTASPTAQGPEGLSEITPTEAVVPLASSVADPLHRATWYRRTPSADSSHSSGSGSSKSSSTTARCDTGAIPTTAAT